MKQVTAWIVGTITATTLSSAYLHAGDTTENLPFVDYQWLVSADACPERGLDTLRKTGFKVTNKKELVGTKDEYKAVVACVGESADIAVFIVAGPDYGRAKSLALKMKDNF